MGNFKFRFSDMMPNAWFYKLKDMGRRRSRNQKTSTYSMRKKQLASTATTAPQPPKSKQPHHLSHSRKSYYFTRDPISSFDSFYKSPNSPKSHFPDPPRKSSKQTASKKKSTKSSPKLVTSSVSAGCNCRSTFESVRGAKSDFSPEYPISPLDSSPEKDLRLSPLPELSSDEALAIDSFDTMVAFSSSCDCKDNSDSKDIILELDKVPATRQFEKRDLFHSIAPEVELAPILTKPAKFTVTEINPKENKEQAKHRKSTTKSEEGNARRSLSVKASKELTKATALKEQRRTDPVRRVSANSPGMRLRVKSPRIASITQGGRRSVSSSSSSSSRRSVTDSFAVVKSSFDPQKDFKESMLEMIVENNIRASKDLEELLACYLSLNSDEYHDLIIKVFKQIWFDLSDFQRKN